jgi:hypothetical protein
MKGVYTDEVFDPVTEEAYLEEGSSNVELLNLDLHGGDTFYIRSSVDVLIQDGEVGDATGEGETCKVGAAYLSPVLCERITIRGIHFHDMTLPPGSTQHHEALFISDSDDVLIEDCVFGPNVWGSTADLFFTNEQTEHATSNVTIRGCHFMQPSCGASSAIQWHDKGADAPDVAPYDGYTLIGNLFEDCYPNFGTIKRDVSNFHVGVNYGMLPQTQYDHARGLGITFEEYPFRPAEEWPGHVAPPDPDNPCAEVEAELAAALATLDADEKQIAAMQSQIDEAIRILQGSS